MPDELLTLPNTKQLFIRGQSRKDTWLAAGSNSSDSFHEVFQIDVLLQNRSLGKYLNNALSYRGNHLSLTTKHSPRSVLSLNVNVDWRSPAFAQSWPLLWKHEAYTPLLWPNSRLGNYILLPKDPLWFQLEKSFCLILLPVVLCKGRCCTATQQTRLIPEWAAFYHQP